MCHLATKKVNKVNYVLITSAKWVLSGIIALFVVVGVAYGITWLFPEKPAQIVVCHAPTEDSDITDCDYRDGGWYPKTDKR